MTDSTAINLLAKSVAKGALVQIQGVKELADRETARSIHAELVRLAHEFSRKHGFQMPVKRKEVV